MPTAKQLADTIRILSIDSVQKANSGHPGMPMGMADIATVLWQTFLQHNPANPNWPNRDRFVLSNGHGSMLLYALLHLSGYDLSLNDLQQFRQLGSKTPGHPEYRHTPGVETTTGPLGQGLANAVGMALAESMLRQQFNTSAFPVIDHYTYAFLGDGCLMEGISHEACSLAGTLKLNKLICFWDDNGISIDGKVEQWFSDDTAQRFRAYDWHVIENIDGHDHSAIAAAIQAAQQTTQPSLLCCKTVIGFGSPQFAGTAKVHGAPLGADEIAAVRAKLGWQHPPFTIPDNISEAWHAVAAGQQRERAWQNLFADYQHAEPSLAAELTRRLSGKLPQDFTDKTEAIIQQTAASASNVATRKAQLNILNQLAAELPELVGGSADLTGSNLTQWQDCPALKQADHSGRYIYYGVREFAMSAITNGIALYGGFIPYAGTFLVFSDYARNAIRMAGLMQLPSIFVYTHDSIGLGEDGPTHQPIEHLAMLRLTPNVAMWRPADAVETAVAWQQACLSKDKPTCLALSRQTLPHQERDAATINRIRQGGYILKDCEQQPALIIIATGSEVEPARQACEHLNQIGIACRLVAMPSTDTFDQQPIDYREQVLPSAVTKRIAVEAASADYWYKYVGQQGKIIGMCQFGESGKAEQLFVQFGFHATDIISSCKAYLNLTTG